MTDHEHVPVIDDPDLPGKGFCYTCAHPIKQYVGMDADENITYRWLTEDEFNAGFVALLSRIQRDVAPDR